MKRSHCHPAVAFTLIELVVVVSIIAVLAAISVPAFTTITTEARASRAAAHEKQLAIREQALQSPDPESWPIIDDARFDLSLKSTDHRLGLEVYTRFHLHGEGEVTFRKPKDAAGPVHFMVLFPLGTTEAWNVRLLVSSESEPVPREPDDVVYSQSGIAWPIDCDEPVTAQVTFVTTGRERFELKLPPSSRLRSIAAALDLSGVPSGTIPEYSLQPTRTEADLHTWEFTSLVSHRDIVVELPGAESVLGRLVVLVRFMALSLLLFGAGFWYLTEQRFPGALEHFRGGHFLLLAINYLMFFFIFAVVIYQGHAGLLLALGIAAAGSIPLLAIHLGRIVEPRFALTRVLPFAVLTLGLMINGVYGGALREYLYLACLIVLIGYLTVTYRQPKERQPALVAATA